MHEQVAYKAYRYHGQVERTTLTALVAAEAVVLAFGTPQPLRLPMFESHSCLCVGAPMP